MLKFLYTIVLCILIVILSVKLDAKDENSKNFSPNNAYATIYNWFAMFDNQEDIQNFLVYINPQNIDYNFLGEELKSIEDFKTWYINFKKNIKSNTHLLQNVSVKKLNNQEYEINFIVQWDANFYNGSYVSKQISQNIHLKIIDNKIYIIKIVAKEVV